MSDLFGFFNKVNSGDFSAVDKLEDSEVKELSPFVMSMWMHGAVEEKEAHVILTDMYCNDYLFSLGKHPRLLLKLIIHANSELGDTRYKFVKTTTGDEVKSLKLIARYYECGMREARDIRKMLTKEEIEYIKELFGE